MMIWVDENGAPRKVIVGKTSGDQELEEAAMDVLSYWRLQPPEVVRAHLTVEHRYPIAYTIYY
jgi:TonB family C-terminal domain